MIPTPECDKMAEVREKSQAIGEFLEWLRSEKGVRLGKRFDYTAEGLSGNDVDYSEFMPYSYSTNRLLAEHFGIDMNKVEQEKRAILRDLRVSGCDCECCRQEVCVCRDDPCPCNWRPESRGSGQGALIMVIVNPRTKKVHALGSGHGRQSVGKAGGWLGMMCWNWKASREDDELAPRWRRPGAVTCKRCATALTTTTLEYEWIAKRIQEGCWVAWGTRVPVRPSQLARELACGPQASPGVSGALEPRSARIGALSESQGGVCGTAKEAT